jgi:hypothetical protein
LYFVQLGVYGSPYRQSSRISRTFSCAASTINKIALKLIKNIHFLIAFVLILNQPNDNFACRCSTLWKHCRTKKINGRIIRGQPLPANKFHKSRGQRTNYGLTPREKGEVVIEAVVSEAGVGFVGALFSGGRWGHSFHASGRGQPIQVYLVKLAEKRQPFLLKLKLSRSN